MWCEWLCERVTESLHAFNTINWPWHIKVQSGHNNKVTFRVRFFLRFNVLVYSLPNPKTNVWYTFWHFLNSFIVSFLWIDSRFNYSGSETRNQFTWIKNTAFQINPCIIRISNFSFARDMITSLFSFNLGIFHFYISHNTPCLPPRPHPPPPPPQKKKFITKNPISILAVPRQRRKSMLMPNLVGTNRVYVLWELEMCKGRIPKGNMQMFTYTHVYFAGLKKKKSQNWSAHNRKFK